jgi:hypothetical protein
LIIETRREDVKWPDTNPSAGGQALFRGFQLHIERHKPISSKSRKARFETGF